MASHYWWISNQEVLLHNLFRSMNCSFFLFQDCNAKLLHFKLFIKSALLFFIPHSGVFCWASLKLETCGASWHLDDIWWFYWSVVHFSYSSSLFSRDALYLHEIISGTSLERKAGTGSEPRTIIFKELIKPRHWAVPMMEQVWLSFKLLESGGLQVTRAHIY